MENSPANRLARRLTAVALAASLAPTELPAFKYQVLKETPVFDRQAFNVRPAAFPGPSRAKTIVCQGGGKLQAAALLLALGLDASGWLAAPREACTNQLAGLGAWLGGFILAGAVVKWLSMKAPGAPKPAGSRWIGRPFRLPSRDDAANWIVEFWAEYRSIRNADTLYQLAREFIRREHHSLEAPERYATGIRLTRISEKRFEASRNALHKAILNSTLEWETLENPGIDLEAAFERIVEAGDALQRVAPEVDLFFTLDTPDRATIQVQILSAPDGRAARAWPTTLKVPSAHPWILDQGTVLAGGGILVQYRTQMDRQKSPAPRPLKPGAGLGPGLLAFLFGLALSAARVIAPASGLDALDARDKALTQAA